MFTCFEHQVFLLQERHTEIQNFITKKADRKGILALLLSAEIEFSPLDMKEVAFDVIGSHCLVPDTHVSLFLYHVQIYLLLNYSWLTHIHVHCGRIFNEL